MTHKNFKGFALSLALLSIPAIAWADARDLATKSMTELPALTGTSAASGDLVPIYDVSALTMKTIDLGANMAVLAGVTATAAEINYNDIATLGTVAASKTLTFDASIDAIVPTGGLMTFQSGSQITMNSGSTLAVSGTFSGATLTLTGDLSGDGGDQLFGFLQDQVASTTTTVTVAQCGKTFVSNSADVMTLPEASTALGCRYTFVCGTADNFDINPNDGTDQISSVSTTDGATAVVTLAPAAGDAIRCTDIGGSITLEAVGADLWAQVAGGNGIWTDVN